MNEIIAILIVAAVQSIAYFAVYPRLKNITGLRIADVIFSFIAIALVGLLSMFTNSNFWFFGFEANWLLFAFIVYVVLETPAWYFYMKAHPEQGTIAELYGISKKSNSKKLAKNIDSLMRDTKWNRIRSGRAQKVLVVLGVLSLIAAPVAFWFEELIKPGIGILFVIPIFLIWWLLRISVRLVADAPDEYLDEFQVMQRDRTYLKSFRILAVIVSALAVTLMVSVISMDSISNGNSEYWQIQLNFGQVNAIIWSLLGATILIPNMVLAWSQSQDQAISHEGES